VKLIIRAKIDLDEPTVGGGFITWLTFQIGQDADEEGESLSGADPVGRGQVAIVHVARVLEAEEDLWGVLDADSGEMEALHSVYFEESWFKDEFAGGFGDDLLYVSELEIEPAWQGRNIELAVVRRLCDTLGQGCELAVVRYTSMEEAGSWERIGFEVSTPGKPRGLMHMSLGYVNPRVVDLDGSGRFRVVANLSHEAREKHH
jgi:ribosomal protein S18 acetylase RimI-like enzyme